MTSFYYIQSPHLPQYVALIEGKLSVIIRVGCPSFKYLFHPLSGFYKKVPICPRRPGTAGRHQTADSYSAPRESHPCTSMQPPPLRCLWLGGSIIILSDCHGVPTNGAYAYHDIKKNVSDALYMHFSQLLLRGLSEKSSSHLFLIF